MDDNKKTAEGQFSEARSLHRLGRLAEAERLYRAAIEGDSAHAEAREWLGALCLQQGKTDEAIRWLAEAAALHPDNAAFHDNLAAALVRAQRLEEAAAAYRKSLAAAPGSIETRVQFSTVLRHLGRPGEAMACLEQAVALDPHLNVVCRDTATLPNEEARCKAVLENSRHILARYPSYAPAHYSQACALLNLGRMSEACRAAERALVLDPTLPARYHILIYAGNAAQKAAAMSALEQLAAQEAVLPEDGQATLHFLLAKGYDDQKRHAEAFKHLEKANAIKRRSVAYDEAREIGRMQAVAAAFTRARLQDRGSGHPSQVPVFVVGIPRSGTTLVEQILASHPAVHGAGELSALADFVEKGHAGSPFPEASPAVDADSWRRLGEAYVAQLAAVAPGKKRVTDKRPLNFLLIGAIRLALPEARIIHVMRDPLDTCFSCYSLSFAGDVGFAYDMGELGRYYKAYEALMAHWRAVLPEGAMLEVRYETLVDDLPVQARRIVEYCGLGWDARCLEFHKTARAVATASLWEVRQPLYKGSVGRAQNYAEHLGPLRDALELSR